MKQASLRVILGSAMGLRLVMAALNFGLFWLLSRRLSTEELGGFSLLTNFYLMGQLLTLLGLSAPLIRRAATERQNLAPEMSNALAIALPAAALLTAVLVAVGHWNYPSSLFLPFCLLSAALLPGAWTLVAETTLLGMERMADMARIQCVEVVVRVLLSVGVVELGHGLTGVFAVFLVMRLAMALVYLRLPGLPRPGWRLLSPVLLRRNLGEIPMYFGIALLATLSSRLDLLVLSRVQGLHDVGVYAAASRLYDASLMLPTVAAFAMMPTLARLYAEDQPRFRDLLQQVLRVSLAVGMVLAVAIAALSPWLIELLYKPAMAGAGPVLSWLIFGAVLTTVDQVLSSTMLAAKAQSQDMKSLALALLLLAAGLPVGAAWWGPLGTAAAVVVAMAFRVTLRMHWAVHSLGLTGLWRDWLRQLFAALIGAAALWVARPWGPLAAMAAGCLSWALAARLTGILAPRWWRIAQGGLVRLLGRARA